MAVFDTVNHAGAHARASVRLAPGGALTMRLFTPPHHLVRGFTLIELLVIIAIIAILAAFLFPVFAQVRAKARASACLSNVRQVGAAFHMYVQDYDELCPSHWSASGTCLPSGENCANEWWFGLRPYIKNIEMLYCPERTDGSGADYNAYGQALGIERYAGYGYNMGPIGNRGGGLMNPPSRTPAGQIYLAGRSLAQIPFPAQTFAFGDTYDVPAMSISINWAGETWAGTTNGALRHSGVLNYAFVDGHARAIRVRGGFVAFARRLLMPRDTDAAAFGFCPDRSEVIATPPAQADPVPVPTPIPCGQVPAWIAQNFPPCTASSRPGSSCLFSD